MLTCDFSELIREKKKKHEDFNVGDQFKGLTYEELREIQLNNTIPLNGMALNTYGDFNISAMIRTASIMGFENFYVFGRRVFDKRGLVGSNHYINIVAVDGLKIVNVGNPLPKISVNKLKEFIETNNISPIIMEINGEDIRDVDWKNYILSLTKYGKKPTIIVGNEWDGFDDDVFDFLVNYKYSKLVKIPQRGVIRSLNVGHCFAIAAWEISRSF